jgi:hypothetical protein
LAGHEAIAIEREFETERQGGFGGGEEKVSDGVDGELLPGKVQVDTALAAGLASGQIAVERRIGGIDKQSRERLERIVAARGKAAAKAEPRPE